MRREIEKGLAEGDEVHYPQEGEIVPVLPAVCEQARRMFMQLGRDQNSRSLLTEQDAVIARDKLSGWRLYFTRLAFEVMDAEYQRYFQAQREK